MIEVEKVGGKIKDIKKARLTDELKNPRLTRFERATLTSAG